MLHHAGLVVPLQTAAFAPFISIMRFAILQRHAFPDDLLSCRVRPLSICNLDKSRPGDKGTEGEGGDKVLLLRLHPDRGSRALRVIANGAVRQLLSWLNIRQLLSWLNICRLTLWTRGGRSLRPA